MAESFFELKELFRPELLESKLPFLLSYDLQEFKLGKLLIWPPLICFLQSLRILSYMASLSLEHLYGEEEGRELANQG
jgi:hypothetical protein